MFKGCLLIALLRYNLWRIRISSMLLKRILTTCFVLSFGTALTIGQEANDVPAYHKTIPTKAELAAAPILKPDQLQSQISENFQRHAYELAAKPGMAKVLYQLPCYCHCDRSLGHTSLHSCFSNHDEHGAHCGTCLQETYYAYKMTKQGWSVAKIREGI